MKTNKLLVLGVLLTLTNTAIAMQPLTAEQWKAVQRMRTLDREIFELNIKKAQTEEVLKQIDEYEKKKAELKELYVEKARIDEMEAQQAAKQRRQSMIEWQINKQVSQQPTTEW